MQQMFDNLLRIALSGKIELIDKQFSVHFDEI